MGLGYVVWWRIKYCACFVSFFVGMLNINEMYKVCSDFCGGLSLEMVFDLVCLA